MSVLPAKMSISCSKASLTSSLADWIASTMAKPDSGVKASSSIAANIFWATSAVATASTAGLVASSVACSSFSPSLTSVCNSSNCGAIVVVVVVEGEIVVVTGVIVVVVVVNTVVVVVGIS